jgi:hypothetical protein
LGLPKAYKDMTKINDLRNRIEFEELRKLNAAHCYFIGEYIIINLGRFIKYQKLEDFKDSSFPE